MKNMKKMTALACAAMMMASMGITGCAKADGQTKEETKAVVVETPAGTETSATTENEATMLPGGENPEKLHICLALKHLKICTALLLCLVK